MRQRDRPQHAEDDMRRRATWQAAALALAGAWFGGCATDPEAAYFLNTPTRANVYVAPAHRPVAKVAVLPFKGPTELIGASVSDHFVTELLLSGRYEVVERSQLAAVLGETELALSGLSSAEATKAGSMAGADGVVVGTVAEHGETAEGGRTYAVVGISARLIDCANGKVIWSVDLARRAESSSVSISEHARQVVHEMMAAVYRRLQAVR